MLREKLLLLPNKPGCYLMKNQDNIIIYVGKAKNLKNRVNSYFRGKHTGKTAKLVSEIVDFEYVVLEKEVEAFILELNLIKKYNPKYNILLRDDKSYPYIELTDEKIPRLLIVRSIKRKKNKTRLYGPYPNVTAARKTVILLNEIYPLRKCQTMSKKPCLYYHINQCLGYCIKDIDFNKVEAMKQEIIQFLKGNNEFVIKKLEEDMTLESNKLNFERAKELKDMLDYVNITLTKQKVEISDNKVRDIFGFYEKENYLSIQTFFVREGKIIEKHSNIIDLVDTLEEELTRYIANFYDNFVLPKELLVPNIVDSELLESTLNIEVKKPIKGEKLKLINLANDNAKIYLEERLELIKRDETKTTLANEELREILNLKKLDRIEIFDNSNIFGTFNVSGMVVFKNGVPAKNEYRKFKISIDKNDDYGTMREVIYRRYFRVLKDSLEKPDLIIVDGGIGQINVARETLSSLNINIPVVGLKKDSRHMTESLLAHNPLVEIPINKRSNVFHYLERMQEEVHNFTIHYHIQIRSKGSLESILDNIDGIGEKRKKELLRKYKTINKMKTASISELSSILPSNVAKNLLEFLNN